MKTKKQKRDEAFERTRLRMGRTAREQLHWLSTRGYAAARERRRLEKQL